MKLKKRLMIRFLAGVVFLAFLLATSFIIFYYVAASLQEEQRDELFPEEYLQKMVSATQLYQGQPVLPLSWEQELKARNEWVQILDQDGREIYRYAAPDNTPVSYTPSELVRYIKKEGIHDHQIHTWYQSINNQTYTWILGRKKIDSILQQIKEATSIHNQTISIASPLLAEVKQRKGWVQILDKQGVEIYQYLKPKKIPTKYTPGEYVHVSRNNDLQLATGLLNGQEFTWILRENLPPTHEVQQNKAIAFTFYTAIMAVLVLFLLFSYHFGQRLGSPLLLLMRWLKNLSEGIYQEPQRKSESIRDVKTGEIKKPYVVYKEVFQAMERLSVQLQEVQLKRQRLDQSREEWIAGVSHDLKTPLSTIKGYAELYYSPAYNWSPQEIEEYLGLVIRKAEDIQHLIDDLNITFQIKNNALSLERTLLDMKEFIRVLVSDVLNVNGSEEVNISLDLPLEQKVMYSIDQRWLKRALANLLTNAILHNPPHTPIQIKLQRMDVSTKDQPSALKIEIIDQGVGMDEKMVSQLFQRYYQGTIQSKRGMGLGMSIAKQLIELHDGEIEVSSQINEGTHIIIYLPEARKRYVDSEKNAPSVS